METREIHLRMPWGVLALKTWNSDKLSPVLVIHGAKHNAGAFDGLIPLLSEKYFYVCVDLPGHGYSAAFTQGLPLSFMQYITALQRLIRFYNWSNFGLIGHSIGAHMVVFLAAAEKFKVNFAILLDGTARSFLSDETFLTRNSAELDDLLQEEAGFYSRPVFTTFDAAVKRFQTSVFPITEKAATDILSRILVKTDQGFYNPTDPRALFKTMAHMTQNVIFYNCKNIVCPILIIYPEQSLLHQIHHDSEFHKTILNILIGTHSLSRSKYINGDHCVHCNNPEAVAIVINEFLSDINQKQQKINSKI